MYTAYVHVNFSGFYLRENLSTAKMLMYTATTVIAKHTFIAGEFVGQDPEVVGKTLRRLRTSGNCYTSIYPLLSPGVPEVPEHEIVWFDVRMDDSTAVEGGYDREDLSRKVHHQTFVYSLLTYTVGVGDVLLGWGEGVSYWREGGEGGGGEGRNILPAESHKDSMG